MMDLLVLYLKCSKELKDAHLYKCIIYSLDITFFCIPSLLGQVLKSSFLVSRSK